MAYRRLPGLTPIDVYLFVGDSNTYGAAAMPGSPVYVGPYNQALLWYKPTLTTVENGQWNGVKTGSNTHPGYARSVSAANYGATSGFAYEIVRLKGPTKVAIIKCGISGATLAAKTGTPNDFDQSTGEGYSLFVNDFMRRGMEQLVREGYRPTIKEVTVRLGTNDCVPAVYNLAAFKAEVQLFCAAIRTDTGNASLPIYWVQVCADLYLDTLTTIPQVNVDAIRLALTDCVTVGNPAFISGLTLINYDNRTTYPIGADFVHFTAAGYDAQGLYEAGIMAAL